MRAHDADGEGKECEVDEAEEEQSPEVGREGEQREGKRGEGRGEEEQRELRGGDEGVLEALLRGVVVEEVGVVGAEHVAGGVVAAEVDGAGADGGAEAEADDE